MYAPTKTEIDTAITGVLGRVRGEVSEGHSPPPAGPGGATDVLVLPSRQLDPLAIDDSGGVAVRNGALTATGDQRRSPLRRRSSRGPSGGCRRRRAPARRSTRPTRPPARAGVRLVDRVVRERDPPATQSPKDGASHTHQTPIHNIRPSPAPHMSRTLALRPLSACCSPPTSTSVAVDTTRDLLERPRRSHASRQDTTALHAPQTTRDVRTD